MLSTLSNILPLFSLREQFHLPRKTVCETKPRKYFLDVKAFVLLLANKIH